MMLKHMRTLATGQGDDYTTGCKCVARFCKCVIE